MSPHERFGTPSGDPAGGEDHQNFVVPQDPVDFVKVDPCAHKDLISLAPKGGGKCAGLGTFGKKGLP